MLARSHPGGKGSPRVKITALETFLVPPRWLFLRVATDEGITGWGEPVVEGRAETVQALIGELADYLVGVDPLRIEDHWQVLTKGGFYRGGPILSSAVAGIDQALWDIAGKAYGAPVYQLLGGPVRDRVRVYAWIGGDMPRDAAELAKAQAEAGFTAVKMNASAALEPIDTPARTAEVVDRLTAVREAIGDACDIVADFHGRMSVAMSRRLLRLLEPLHPLFVEEPAPCGAWSPAPPCRSPPASGCIPGGTSGTPSRRASPSPSPTCPTPAASQRSGGSPR